MKLGFRRLARDERGQDLLEYALVVAGIGLAGVAVLDLLREALGSTYEAWNTGVNDLWAPDDPQ